MDYLLDFYTWWAVFVMYSLIGLYVARWLSEKYPPSIQEDEATEFVFYMLQWTLWPVFLSATFFIEILPSFIGRMIGDNKDKDE